MNTFKIIILIWLALQVIVSVALIGKPRKPRTPTEGVCALLKIGAIAALVVFA